MVHQATASSRFTENAIGLQNMKASGKWKHSDRYQDWDSTKKFREIKVQVAGFLTRITSRYMLKLQD